MNFLAHLYLSGDREDLRFGNFIGDAVRGKNYSQYNQEVQKGILLHRAIDTFTGQHPIFRKHCKVLYPEHGHYARVIIDVIYDHFLASNWNKYHRQSLPLFALDFYQAVALRENELPSRMKKLFQMMNQQNWLLQYATLEGLHNILFHMNKRTSFPSQFPEAIKIIENQKEAMQIDFDTFFLDLKSFCKNHSELHL
ncbi:MAG: ACP phosphodiesterase [Flavobacteriaceae bacterium]